MTKQLDLRELIPVDYKLKDITELEALKASIMRSINQAEGGLQEWHREYTAIRLELKRRALEQEGQGNS